MSGMSRGEGATANQMAQTWSRVWDGGIRTAAPKDGWLQMCALGTNTGQDLPSGGNKSFCFLKKDGGGMRVCWVVMKALQGLVTFSIAFPSVSLT